MGHGPRSFRRWRWRRSRRRRGGAPSLLQNPRTAVVASSVGRRLASRRPRPKMWLPPRASLGAWGNQKAPLCRGSSRGAGEGVCPYRGKKLEYAWSKRSFLAYSYSLLRQGTTPPVSATPRHLLRCARTTQLIKNLPCRLIFEVSYAPYTGEATVAELLLLCLGKKSSPRIPERLLLGVFSHTQALSARFAVARAHKIYPNRCRRSARCGGFGSSKQRKSERPFSHFLAKCTKNAPKICGQKGRKPLAFSVVWGSLPLTIAPCL